MLELVIKPKDTYEADFVLSMVQKMITEGYTSGVDPTWNLKNSRISSYIQDRELKIVDE